MSNKIQFLYNRKQKKDKKRWILGKLKSEPITENERNELLRLYNSL